AAGTAPPGLDRVRVEWALPAAGFDPLTAHWGLDPAAVGALATLGVTGEVTADLRPDLVLRFGLDGSGFFLDPTTALGAVRRGTAAASGALFNVLGLTGRGELSADFRADLVGADGTADDKLRPAELELNQAVVPLVITAAGAALEVDAVFPFLDRVD